jgi:hypothetical protein
MQLSYRGTKYQAQINAVNTVKSAITARFLGQTYTLHQTNYQSPSQSDVYKYRGIVYQK